MYAKSIVPLIALAFLGACRDPGPTAAEAGPSAEPVAQAPAAPRAQVAAPVERRSSFASPVAGGITNLPFQFHVSVDREVVNKKTGIASREVGIEFLESSVPEVEAVLTAELEKIGYAQASREEQGKAIRAVYTRQGAGDVLAWVRPGAPRGARYALQMPDAKGTIYLAYPVQN